MGFFLILPILVGGFVYCHKHPEYFLKLHRYEGQYLYLQSGYQGLKSLVIALFLNFSFLKILEVPTYLGFRLGNDYVTILSNCLRSLEFNEHVEIVSWGIWISFTMIFIVPLIMSPFYKLIKYGFYRAYIWKLNKTKDRTEPTSFKDFSYRPTIMKSLMLDSPLETLLYESITSKGALMFTLDDRKVYVGNISLLGEPNETEKADKEITIIPIISGYRDKDTLTVTFTTHYEGLSGNFSTVIKRDKITSVTKYDQSIYDEFQSKVQKTKLEKDSNFYVIVIN